MQQLAAAVGSGLRQWQRLTDWHSDFGGIFHIVDICGARNITLLNILLLLIHL